MDEPPKETQKIYLYKINLRRIFIVKRIKKKTEYGRKYLVFSTIFTYLVFIFLKMSSFICAVLIFLKQIVYI